MKAVDPALQAKILSGIDLQRLRRLCEVMTAIGIVFLALPCLLAWVLPQSQPSWTAETPSLDWFFSLVLLGQVLFFTGSFAVKLYWAWASRRPAAAIDPVVWSLTIHRLLILRFALCQGVCLLGALAFYMAYAKGFLTEALHVWLLGILPLLSLAWMMPHWPDETVLRKVFFRS
jgi:hypothetical protein